MGEAGLRLRSQPSSRPGRPPTVSLPDSAAAAEAAALKEELAEQQRLARQAGSEAEKVKREGEHCTARAHAHQRAVLSSACTDEKLNDDFMCCPVCVCA